MATRWRRPKRCGSPGSSTWHGRAVCSRPRTPRGERTVSVKPIPEALPVLTPHLVVRDAPAAIEHYKAALAARETFRTLAPDGRGLTCGLMVGEARVVSPTTLGGTPVALHLFVARVDEVFARAVAAGMTVEIPVTDFFWGER